MELVEQADDRAVAKSTKSRVNKAVHAAGGERLLLARIASGEMINKIARELGVDRNDLSLWLRSTPERAAALAHAREVAADTMVEDGLDLVDQATTPADMKVAETKAKYRQWLAGKWNRDQYGDGPQVQVNITADNMHLDALRNRG